MGLKKMGPTRLRRWGPTRLKESWGGANVCVVAQANRDSRTRERVEHRVAPAAAQAADLHRPIGAHCIARHHGDHELSKFCHAYSRRDSSMHITPSRLPRR